jgi:hypothetical protein
LIILWLHIPFLAFAETKEMTTNEINESVEEEQYSDHNFENNQLQEQQPLLSTGSETLK